MPSIIRGLVISFIVPPVILVLLSLAFPFLQSLQTGFPGISCGFFDLFRIHILLMWVGWAALLYLSLNTYDICKKYHSHSGQHQQSSGYTKFLRGQSKISSRINPAHISCNNPDLPLAGRRHYHKIVVFLL